MSGGKRFWRSLEEYQHSDAFGDMLKAEFPSIYELWTVDRRQVLQVMGASLALAGMTGCKPVRSDDVVPFVNRPDGFIEGRTGHYATAVLFDGYAQPVLATTSAGRPIKLDGNPDHPAFRGGSTPFMQAAILDLYDPDRSQAPLMGGHSASWADFDGQMTRWRAEWAKNGGAGLRILVGPTTSPTMFRQIAELRTALPQARVHLFDPTGTYYAAATIRLRPNLSTAQVVVSLDDDLLGPGPSQAIHGRAWGERHGDAPANGRLRLLMAETTPTQTGAKADASLAVPPSRLPMLAQAVAAAAGVSGGEVALTDQELTWARQAGAALASARGRSLLTVGRFAPPQLHSLALQVNQALGNLGKTCDIAPQLSFVPDAGGSFLDLARDIHARKVAALFVLGANPIYQSPGDIDFAKLYAMVPLRVHAGTHVDETAARSNWHLPTAHVLEDWSDARSPDGLATIIQPLVQPMYDSRSAHEVLAALTSDHVQPAREIVRQTWASPLRDDNAWTSALKTGFVAMAASPAVPPAAAAVAAAQPANVSDGQVEIVLPTRPDNPRRQLRQQRLAPGASKAIVQDDVGECRRDQSRTGVPNVREERRHRRSREQRPDHQGTVLGAPRAAGQRRDAVPRLRPHPCGADWYRDWI